MALNSQAISFAVHIFGIVFWVGGLLFLTRFLKKLVPPRLEDKELVGFARISWNGFILPGAAIALASGLYQLFLMGISYYMKQGWFHGKLTFIIVLLAVTAIVGFEVRKVGSGATPSVKRLGACHGLTSALLVLTIAITYLGRGY